MRFLPLPEMQDECASQRIKGQVPSILGYRKQDWRFSHTHVRPPRHTGPTCKGEKEEDLAGSDQFRGILESLSIVKWNKEREDALVA